MFLARKLYQLLRNFQHVLVSRADATAARTIRAEAELANITPRDFHREANITFDASK